MTIRKIQHIGDHLFVEHQFKGQDKGVLAVPHHAHSLPTIPPFVKGYVVRLPTNTEVLLVADRDKEGKWGYQAYRKGYGPL